MCKETFHGDGKTCNSKLENTCQKFSQIFILFKGRFFFYISPENVCHPNPCKNGATCNPAESSFDCECVKGWTGPLCEGMSFNALHLLLLRKVFNSLVLSLEILDAKLYGFHESNYTAFVKFLNETINPGVWKVHVVIDRRSKKSL